MNTVIKLPSLALHLSLPVAVAAVSSVLAGDRGAAYAALRLPGFALPLGALDAMWAVCFGCMGAAAYLIFQSRRLRRDERGACMGLYGLLLVAGGLWNLLFFRFRFASFAAWWSVLLVAVALLTGALFFRIRRRAGLFAIPAALWLVYLGFLSFGAAVLN